MLPKDIYPKLLASHFECSLNPFQLDSNLNTYYIWAVVMPELLVHSSVLLHRMNFYFELFKISAALL